MLQKIILFIFLSLSISHGKKVERTWVCLYDTTQGEDTYFSKIHQKLELFIQHYGFLCDYKDLSKEPVLKPENYKGIISFPKYVTPLYIGRLATLLKSFQKAGKQRIYIGQPPFPTRDYEEDGLESFESAFSIKIGPMSSDSKTLQTNEYQSTHFGYEAPQTTFTQGKFNELEPGDKNCEALLKISIKSGEKSSPILLCEKSAFIQDDHAIFKTGTHDFWKINPFYLFGKILAPDFPIPEVVNRDTKRIAYIHIDGDGALNKTEIERDKLSSKLALEFLIKRRLKMGVSFIANEIDPEYQGNEKVQNVARQFYAQDFVEPASHTYSHPYSWEKGIVAFSTNPTAATPAIYGGIPALREKDGEINMKFEVLDSLEFINRFTKKSRPAKIIYYSGDCKPTEAQLKFLDQHNIKAFNGGDSFLDDSHPSINYVYPYFLPVGSQIQIYSSGSNENVFTHLWSENHWAFQRVIQTWERTGNPVRILPVNLYYHFYVFEKQASYESMIKIYDWLLDHKNELHFLYPSEYISIVQNLPEIQLSRLGSNQFQIENMKKLRDFRFQGKVKVRSKDLSKISYDPSQNVTYFSLREGVSKTIVEVWRQ